MKGVVLNLSLIVLAVSVSSCFRSSSDSQAVSTELTASDLASLHLRVLPGLSHDSVEPVQETGESDIVSLSEAQIVDGEIFLTNRIDLPTPDQRPLFLVWDSQSLSSPIREATYEYQYLDDSNDLMSTDDDPHEIHCDDDRGTCFISLRKVFEGKEYSIDPRDQQLLDLRFLLGDGTTMDATIRFLLDGYNLSGLPSTASTLRNPAAAPDVANAIHTAGQGWAYHARTFTNPNGRAVLLWPQASGTDIELQEYAGRPSVLSADLSGPLPGKPIMDEVLLKTQLIPVGVRVYRGTSADPTFFPFNAQGTAAVLIEPNETIDLQWVAQAAPGVVIVQAPQPAVKSLPQCAQFPGWVIPPYYGNCQQYNLVFNSHSDDAGVLGVKVLVTGAVQVKVSETFEDQPGASTAASDVMTVEAQTVGKADAWPAFPTMSNAIF
jgi:hypothetical protein